MQKLQPRSTGTLVHFKQLKSTARESHRNCNNQPMKPTQPWVTGSINPRSRPPSPLQAYPTSTGLCNPCSATQPETSGILGCMGFRFILICERSTSSDPLGLPRRAQSSLKISIQSSKPETQPQANTKPKQTSRTGE